MPHPWEDEKGNASEDFTVGAAGDNDRERKFFLWADCAQVPECIGVFSKGGEGVTLPLGRRMLMEGRRISLRQ